MANVKVKSLTPIYYQGKYYNAGMIIDLDSEVYAKKKDLFEVVQFQKKYENKNIGDKNE